MTLATNEARPRARRTVRTGLLGLALALLAATPAAPLAGAAGSSLGSSGSSGGSAADGGSVSSGSQIPDSLQSKAPKPPALRDDITVPAIVKETRKGDQWMHYTIASPALRREVGVDVFLPKDNSVPRPSIYGLEGVDAPEGYSGLTNGAGVRDFFADKNVNVILTNGGVGSLYTDWDEIDPALGLHKWETYIVDELTPLMDAKLGTNGDKSLLGVSMGAQGAMMLAHRHPGMYKGVALLSGCYSTTDDVGRLAVLETISSRGGDPSNIWGKMGNDEWAAHDTVLNAEALRGMDIYASAATGIPGVHETAADYTGERVLVGAPIEVLSNICTHRLQDRLEDLNIPATFEYHATGVHAWPYWKDQLPATWPTLAHSLSLPV